MAFGDVFRRAIERVEARAQDFLRGIGEDLEELGGEIRGVPGMDPLDLEATTRKERRILRRRARKDVRTTRREWRRDQAKENQAKEVVPAPPSAPGPLQRIRQRIRRRPPPPPPSPPPSPPPLLLPAWIMVVLPNGEIAGNPDMVQARFLRRSYATLHEAEAAYMSLEDAGVLGGPEGMLALAEWTDRRRLPYGLYVGPSPGLEIITTEE